MLLAVDVGNTQTVLGLYDGEQLIDDWRLATERTRTGDEVGVLLGGMLDLDAVDGNLPLRRRFRRWFANGAARRPVGRCADPRRGPGVRTGIRIAMTTHARSGPTGSSIPSPPGSATEPR